MLTARVPWAHWTVEERDDFLAEHLLEQYEEGVSRQLLSDLLAALHRINPRDRYVLSSRVLSYWGALLPPRQAPAAPPEFVFGGASALVLLGQAPIAAVFVLCYVGLLRVSEALNLRGRDVVLGKGVVVLLLASTKRGQEQRVTLHHPETVLWIRRYLLFAEVGANDLVIGVPYGRVLRWVKRLSIYFSFEPVVFTTHSFRRGGASALLGAGVPLSLIMEHGRWLSESSCRGYLRKGQVFMLRLRMHEQPRWRALSLLGNLGGSVFDVKI